MTALDLSRRNALTELMDAQDTDFATYRACLVDLAKVNRLTLAYRPTLRFFARLAASGRLPRGRPLTVVDVGSGYGDMVREIDRWAVRRGLDLEFIGVDLNPSSARAAAEATGSDRPIRYVTANIFDFRPSGRIDIIISSLLTHHLDDASLIRFVSWMDVHAAAAWFINDLHRHPIPYHVFRLASRMLGWHRFVQHDGPVSIARAFAADDWQRILAAAGLGRGAAAIRRHFPFRLCVSRIKS